jgi:putative phosphotransacetylase
MKVILGVSMRHVHLNKDIYQKLFGNEPLNVVKDLRQPTQFASDKFVTIQNGDRKIEHVRVLGPIRNYNQVEISRTDAYFLKVNPPIRTSGDLEGSSPITIIGDVGKVTLNQGCILANRHIHITPDEVKQYHLEGVTKVKIKVNGEKAGILENVYLKIQDISRLELHLDSDDGNAFGLKTGDELEIIELERD